MPAYVSDFHGERHRFKDLKDVLAKASHRRSGDELAELAADDRRAAGRRALGPGRPAAGHVPERPGCSLRDRRSHPPDPRHPRQPGVRRDLPPDGRRLSRLAAVLRGNAGTPGRAGPRDHAGDGRRGLQADAQPGPDQRRQPMPRHHGVPQHPGPARAISVRACSPTIPPTTCAASPRQRSTDCCWAAATPSSASIPPPTAWRTASPCWTCWKRCGCATTSRPRPAS